MLTEHFYTSPLGTDRSTMYFNAHTSIWHLLRDYRYLVVYPILGFRLDCRLRIAPGLHCLPVRLLTVIPIRFARSVSLTGSGLFSRSGSGWACRSTIIKWRKGDVSCMSSPINYNIANTTLYGTFRCGTTWVIPYPSLRCHKPIQSSINLILVGSIHWTIIKQYTNPNAFIFSEL